MLKFNHSRGDTIIEVLFAITVFSLLVVGSLSIMNQGSATAQRSLEISLVRNEIDAQAEALRFLNASYVAAYESGASTAGSNPFSATESAAARSWWGIDKNTATDTIISTFGTCPDSIPSNSFIINTKNAARLNLDIANWSSATTYAQVRYKSTDPNSIDKAEGIWIEAVKPNIATGHNQDNASYIDFHIRACWYSLGQSTPMTLGTIVRLYEPLN